MGSPHSSAPCAAAPDKTIITGMDLVIYLKQAFPIWHYIHTSLLNLSNERVVALKALLTEINGYTQAVHSQNSLLSLLNEKYWNTIFLLLQLQCVLDIFCNVKYSNFQNALMLKKTIKEQLNIQILWVGQGYRLTLAQKSTELWLQSVWKHTQTFTG